MQRELSERGFERVERVGCTRLHSDIVYCLLNTLYNKQRRDIFLRTAKVFRSSPFINEATLRVQR